ncbi:MAG: response regulator [Magnetococcales bacterium]|nr:response regulator [Magnetococcales bacterium]
MFTIRKKIAYAFVGLLALVSAAMAIVGYVTLSGQITQVQEKEISLMAFTQAMSIHERLNSLRRQFVEMATAREIDLYITEFKEDILRYHFKRFQSTFPFLLYANQKGDVEFQSDSKSLLDGKLITSLTDLPQFPQAKDRPNQVMFFPVTEGHDGEPILRMLYVVRTYFDDFGGAILGEIRLSGLFSGASTINPGQTGFSMLVDNKGQILYNQDNTQLFKSFKEIWEKLNPTIEKVVKRKADFGNTLITGLPAVVAVASVPDTPWSVVVVLPHKESIIPSRKIGQLYFLFFLAIAIIGSILSWWMARTITTPLTMLEKATKALAAGNMSTRVDIQSNDEVGGVIQSFNKMAHDLENSSQKLQHEVEERTLLEQEHRKAKKEAENANLAKSEFLASMSHEIRTPMNAILGMTELLASGGLDEEQRIGYLNVLKRNGEALLVLINDILDLSRVEAGQLLLEEFAFDLFDLTEDTLNTFYVMAKEKDIKLTKEIADDVLPIRIGDPTRLRQILVNLLSNAIKFTANGEVSLKISLSLGAGNRDSLQFMVSDTGIGIPADKLDSVFEKFIQVDSSSTRKFGGSGLGLSLCREFVEIMRGKIWAESVEGVGSQFILVLPMPVVDQNEWKDKDDLKMKKAEEADVDRCLSVTKKQVLVVDDSKDNILLIKAFLGKFNIEITVAENGLSGLEQYKTADFDLVLMDIQMPVMDGYMATKAIRDFENEQNRDKTPILALTANALRSDIERSYHAGCDGHLSKPIDKKSFIRAVTQFLQPSGPVNSDNNPGNSS